MSFKGEEEKTSANVCFPESFSVLVVDGDSLSLDEITKMCEQCSYKVTATTKAIEALSILREARSRFDIVISDINMHDMDPFEFIKIVSVDTDLPLVLVSIDDDNDTVVKAINNGACDYLLKPIQINNIKFIWKHVVRSQKWKMEQSKTEPNIEDCQIPLNLSNSDIFNVIESRNVISESSSSSIVAKDDEDIRKKEIAQKKLRYVWTPQLHDKFVAIVDQIGVKNAVPKKILEMMNDPTLTRENVASHLQKYRLFLRKSDESKQQKRQMQTQAINRQMQTQAINRQFNPQAYSYNNQNQVNLNVNKFQHLVQKQINVFGYISPPNQFSPESYSIPEPSFGLQTNNGISSTTTFLNKISSFGVGEICDFETINDSLPPLRRSIKLRKLSHDVPNENLSDAFLHSSTTFPCTINNVSTRLSSTFGENNLSLRNSGNYPDNESIPPKNSR